MSEASDCQTGGSEAGGITERELTALSHLRSSADRFELYNFHPAELLDSLEAVVRPSSQCAAIALFGERGIGRSYLLDAVAHRLCAKGMRVSILHVDLEGYEPDQKLSGFLRYLTSKRRSTVPALSSASPPSGVSSSVWKAFPVALVHSCDAEDWGANAIDIEAAYGIESREKLISLLQRLAADRRVIVHLTDVSDASAPLLEALGAAAESEPNLLLAVSCASGDLALRPTLHAIKATHNVRLLGLTSDGLQSVLDRNFKPHLFPERFTQLVWRASCGSPVRAAVIMYDFVCRGLIGRRSDGRWRISDAAVYLELKGFAKAVRGSWLPSGGDSAFSLKLRQFLFLAGLCSENVPAMLLLDYLRLTGEEAGHFVDFIDEKLVGMEALFTDVQYIHPSFPKQTVYRFSSSLAWRAALGVVSPVEGSRRGGEFLSFLVDQLWVNSRGACKLLLSVARSLGDSVQSERCVRELAWWVGDGEAADLTAFLDRELAQNHISFESVWHTFENTVNRWPPYRRMAILETCRRHPARVPEGRKGGLDYARADLLRKMGKTREAIDAARIAIGALDGAGREKPTLVTGCHTLIATGYAELGESEKAREHLRCALEAAADIGEDRSPSLVAILHELAEGLKGFDENETARLLLERALEAARKLYGPDDLRAAELLRSLSDVLRRTGDLGGARSCVERALEISRGIFGSNSPQVGIILKILADDVRVLGQPQLARDLLEEALEIEIEAGNGESESALTLLKHLADLSCQFGDFNAARHYLQSSVSVDEALHGHANPQMAIQVKLLAEVLLKLSQVEDAVDCLTRALRIEEEMYGREDPRIMQNLAYLEAVLRKSGNDPAANAYLERLRNLQRLTTISGPAVMFD